jgi:hypothetical protein
MTRTDVHGQTLHLAAHQRAAPRGVAAAPFAVEEGRTDLTAAAHQPAAWVASHGGEHAGLRVPIHHVACLVVELHDRLSGEGGSCGLHRAWLVPQRQLGGRPHPDALAVVPHGRPQHVRAEPGGVEEQRVAGVDKEGRQEGRQQAGRQAGRAGRSGRQARRHAGTQAGRRSMQGTTGGRATACGASLSVGSHSTGNVLV